MVRHLILSSSLCKNKSIIICYEHSSDIKYKFKKLKFISIKLERLLIFVAWLVTVKMMGDLNLE